MTPPGPAAARLARWRGDEPDPAAEKRRYDVSTWARPQRFDLTGSRRLALPLIGVMSVAGVIWEAMIRIDGLAVTDDRTMLVAAIIGTLVVFLPMIAYEVKVGGTLEIDPVAQQLRRRSYRARVVAAWPFACVTDVVVAQGPGALHELRIHAGDDRVQAMIPAAAHPMLADSLRAAVGSATPTDHIRAAVAPQPPEPS